MIAITNSIMIGLEGISYVILKIKKYILDIVNFASIMIGFEGIFHITLLKKNTYGKHRVLQQ